MKLPAHSWAFSGALDEALRHRLSKVAVAQDAHFDVQGFFNRFIADKRTHDLTHDDMCTAFSHVVGEKTKLSHSVVDAGTDNVRSLAAARDVKQGKIDLNKITVDEILDAHAKFGTPKRPTGSKLVEVGPMANLSKLSTEQKVYGGLSLIMAGLSAVGAINNFSHAIGKDESGKSTIQWSNVGMGVVGAALAAGTAYLAHQQLRGSSTAPRAI